MLHLSQGQMIAAKWFGLPPFWWGWIIAGLFLVALFVLLLVEQPQLLRPTSKALSLDPKVVRWWTIGILVAALLLHVAGVLGSFNTFDDYRQIHWEKTVTELTSEHIWATTLGSYKGTNQELMYISFQLNWLIAGKAYWVWYLFNLILLPPLMLLVSRLTFLLTKDRAAALIAMAVFAATPQVSELLCWMSVRSHLYGLIFAIASAVAYLEYLNGKGWVRWRWFGLSLLAFFMSQLAKPVYVYIPVWLILFDVYMRRSDWKLALVDKLGHFVVAGLFVYKIVWAGAGNRLIKREPLGGSLLNTIYQDFNLLVEYGRTLFIPVETGLLPEYNLALGPLFVKGTPMVMVNGFAPVASLIILLAVLAITVVLWARFKWGLPLLWYLAAGLTLATVVNIPYRGHAATFEYRYTFSAQLITAVLLGAFFAYLLRSGLTKSRILRFVPVILCIGYLSWGAVETNDNRHAWGTSYDFWIRNAQMYPQGFHSLYYAGKVSQHRGQNFAAVQYLRAAKKYNPRDDPAIEKRLGDNLYYIKDFEGAKEMWIIHFRRKPRDINEKYMDRFEEVGLVPKDHGIWVPRKFKRTNKSPRPRLTPLDNKVKLPSLKPSTKFRMSAPKERPLRPNPPAQGPEPSSPDPKK